MCSAVCRRERYCLRAQGSRSSKDADLLELTYHFSYSPNATDIEIGDITVTEKKGWHYLWIRYEQKKDGTGNKMAPNPCQVDITEIYEEKDFSLLGIGTSAL